VQLNFFLLSFCFFAAMASSSSKTPRGKKAAEAEKEVEPASESEKTQENYPAPFLSERGNKREKGAKTSINKSCWSTGGIRSKIFHHRASHLSSFFSTFPCFARLCEDVHRASAQHRYNTTS
jgi:hypothetical protein